MKNSLLLAIGEKPTSLLEVPLWIINLVAGIYILSPLFKPNDAPNGNLAAAGSVAALKVYGVVLLLIGLFGLIGKAAGARRWGHRLRRIAAYSAFFIFFYFTLLSFLIAPTTLGWTGLFLNALVPASILLRLRWELEDEGTPN